MTTRVIPSSGILALLSVLLDADIEVQSSIWSLVLRCFNNLQHDDELVLQLLNDCEAVHSIKASVIPEVVRRIDFECALLDVGLTPSSDSLSSSGSRSPVLSTLVQQANRFSIALVAKTNDSKLTKSIDTHSRELVAFRFLVSSSTPGPLLHRRSSIPDMVSVTLPMDVVVLHTTTKEKRKGFLYLRKKLKRQVLAATTRLSISSGEVVALAESGPVNSVQFNILDVVDLRTYTMDGDVLHYATLNQLSLLEIVVERKLTSSELPLPSQPTVVAWAFPTNQQRDALLHHLESIRDQARLARSTYGQMLVRYYNPQFSSHLRTDMFRTVQKLYQNFTAYLSLLQSARSKQRMSVMSPRLKLQSSPHSDRSSRTFFAAPSRRDELTIDTDLLSKSSPGGSEAADSDFDSDGDSVDSEAPSTSVGDSFASEFHRAEQEIGDQFAREFKLDDEGDDDSTKATASTSWCRSGRRSGPVWTQRAASRSPLTRPQPTDTINRCLSSL